MRSKFALKVLSHYLDVYQRTFGTRECPLHDPLAAGIVADPTYMTEWLDRAVEVNTTGQTRGATIIDRRAWMAPAADARETRDRNGGKDATPPLVRVPMKVDGPRFVADLIASLK